MTCISVMIEVFIIDIRLKMIENNKKFEYQKDLDKERKNQRANNKNTFLYALILLVFSLSLIFLSSCTRCVWSSCL